MIVFLFLALAAGAQTAMYESSQPAFATHLSSQEWGYDR